MSPVPSHAADCRRVVPRGARFLDSRIGDSGFSQSKKPTRKTSALRHADLRRGRLRRNGMAAPCGRPRASATQACVDFPATVPQAAWRRALDDPSACMPPWRLGRTSPRRPHQPPPRRARQNAGGSCRTYRSLCPVLKFRRHPARRWHHPHACGDRQRGRLPLPRCEAPSSRWSGEEGAREKEKPPQCLQARAA